jgi:hypothetical protein
MCVCVWGGGVRKVISPWTLLTLQLLTFKIFHKKLYYCFLKQKLCLPFRVANKSECLRRSSAFVSKFQGPSSTKMQSTWHKVKPDQWLRIKKLSWNLMFITIITKAHNWILLFGSHSFNLFLCIRLNVIYHLSPGILSILFYEFLVCSMYVTCLNLSVCLM